MVSPGTMLGGRYRLDERIASGGMGDVWRGTDEVLGRTVAVKILLPALLEEPGFAERFRGEARTMATINHPGVVDVYDYGNEGGTAFLVMEYVEGDALSRTLGRVGRLTPSRTMALLAQAADALHAAHEKGIVHRDVKPGNLLVRPNGTLVLTDFGIARSAAVSQLTQAGTVLGTASYLSPEQASGATATALSDVYALGVVAYQCLAGRRPFEGDNPLEIALRHVRDAPPPLPGDIPAPVRQIVDRAMAKDPAARWPSAAGLAQVARQASARLAAAGSATSAALSAGPGGRPGPGAPISAPPTSGPPGPLSPAPGSFAGSGPFAPPTGPHAAGGTRVLGPGELPGGAGAPRAGAGTGAPSSPAAPGQFARGAAGVPPPPASSDTSYTYLGDGGFPPTGPVGGSPQAPSSGGRRRGLIVAIGVLAVVLAVLVCGGGGYLWVHRNDNVAPAASSTTPASAPTTSHRPVVGTGPTRTIDCNGAKGTVASTLRKTLEGFHFIVIEVDVPGGQAGRVVEVTPCGSGIPEGSEITMRVSTGRPASGSTSHASTPAPTTSCDLLGPGGLDNCLPSRR